MILLFLLFRSRRTIVTALTTIRYKSQQVVITSTYYQVKSCGCGNWLYAVAVRCGCTLWLYDVGVHCGYAVRCGSVILYIICAVI